MSGVYFKDIEMPKSCRDCWLKMNCDECEGWECVCVPLHTSIGYFDDLFTDKRREDCPLGPVPDHGDLIDRNALFAKVFRDNYVDRVLSATKDELQTALLNMPLVINNMPVIIPADGEET